MTLRFPTWLARVLLTLAALLVAVWVILAWLHANAIREEFLLPRPAAVDYPLTVLANEAGRVVLTRSPESEIEGLWGLESERAYAQVSTVVRISDDTVERGVRAVVGTIDVGSNVRIDADAYTGDPLTAHGLGFDNDFAIPSDIGPHPAWFIDGRRSTWVIFVHGRGIDRRTESLRITPSLVEQGFPIISMTYRGDIGATPSPSGMRMWGLDEWKDLEAAVTVAKRKGAKDFVIIGSGYGASIVSMFLQESDSVGSVRAVVYDSPVLDLEGVVRRWAQATGVPRPVAWLGRRLTSVRFGMDWSTLDQLERADEFDVPVLMLVGGNDQVTPIEEQLGFAETLGDLATVVRFEQGGTANLWNIDAERYERAVEAFLSETVGSE